MLPGVGQKRQCFRKQEGAELQPAIQKTKWEQEQVQGQGLVQEQGLVRQRREPAKGRK